MTDKLRSWRAAVLVATLTTLSACGSTSFSSATDAGPGGAQATGGSNANAEGGSASVAGGMTSAAGTASDLPCEVQALLAAKCQVCHRMAPPGTLLGSADFRRASKAEPQKTVGQVALERLALTTNLRMPPAPLAAATDAEIAVLSAWIDSGSNPASCADSVPIAPDPYATPLVCTSMKTWTGGNRESPLMRPGGACISCHQSEGEGPLFAVAGTLFPSAHEPDDCNGVGPATGAQVVITEANGTAHTLAVNQAGNFFLEVSAFAFPYQAKVVYQDRERVMVEPQKSGDCNACHSQDGKENAPGRIFLP